MEAKKKEEEEIRKREEERERRRFMALSEREKVSRIFALKAFTESYRFIRKV